MLRVYHRTLFMDSLYNYDLLCQRDGWAEKSGLHWHKSMYLK